MKKLVYMDDNENDLELFSRELSKLSDVEVKTVRDEASFLAELEKGMPDALIVDAAFPRYSGLQALQVIRERDPECPVILLTGSLSDEEAADWLEKGFDRALLKNFPAQLRSAVKREFDRRLIERQRRELDRLRDEKERRENRIEQIGSLAAGMAHDQRNKIVVITLGTGPGAVLRSYVGNNVHALRILDQINSAGASMAEQIDQLLAFARGGIGSKREPLSAEFIVGEVIRLLADKIDKRVTLSQLVFPGTSNVTGNHTNLEQVLVNLCVNGIDAILPNEGEVLITAQNITRPGKGIGHWVEFAVRDTGTGIPADVLPHIFEPFFTTKPEGQGTGLGLQQVKRIVEDHGGEVAVETEAGKGSIFRVMLPFAMREPEQPKANATPPKGNGEVILLVDDEQMIRELIADVLEANGYRVIQVNESREALSVFRSRPDIVLVLTDLAMPHLPGNMLAAQVRAIRPVKVVYITGHGSNVEVNPPADELLAKPFSPEVLLGMVHRVLQAGVDNATAAPAKSAA